jgi:hypothetical protein
MRWKAKVKKIEVKPNSGDIRNIKEFIWYPTFSYYHKEYVWLERAVVKQKYTGDMGWIDIEILPRGAFSDTEKENDMYFFRIMSKKG